MLINVSVFGLGVVLVELYQLIFIVSYYNILTVNKDQLNKQAEVIERNQSWAPPASVLFLSFENVK